MLCYEDLHTIPESHACALCHTFCICIAFMKIYHAADIHLGRTRLDGLLPDADLAAAFRHIAQAAVDGGADVFVLAGDLFDRPQVEPGHLRQAQEGLRILKDAGIPVVAVEGNHDKAFVHSDEPTWVGYLAQDGLLELLRPKFNPDGAVLEPWDPVARSGSYVDHRGVRFVGAGYLGAATPAKVRQILKALDGTMPHVLLLHAGPDYFVGEGGGFSKEDLAGMRQKVTYLALGHIHKPMNHDGWACNPGSPENCDIREADYSSKGGVETGRGYAVVELDPQVNEKPTSLTILSNPRRPICKVDLDCSPFGKKTRDGMEALVAAAARAIASANPPQGAVIDLRLKGEMNLNRIAFDHATTSERIRVAAGAFVVAVDTSKLNLQGEGGEAAGALDGALPREALERQAIQQVVGDHKLCGLTGDQDGLAALFFELKEAVKHGSQPEVIAERISSSSLVDAVQKGRAAEASRQVEAAGDSVEVAI